MFENKYIPQKYALRLMGEERVRQAVMGMILLEFMLLFLTVFSIKTFHVSVTVLFYIVLFGFYGIAFFGNLYLVFNTDQKLKLTPFVFGLSYLLFGTTFFTAFSFMLYGYAYRKIILLTGIYLIGLFLIGVLMRCLKFYNWSRKAKTGTSFSLFFLGVLIGRSLSSYICSLFGLDSTSIVIMICLCFFSLLLGIAGVTYLNKYHLAKSIRNQKPIWYDK